MAKYDFEEALSDSDGDNLLQEEVEALSMACMPSSSASYGDFSEDDDNDDVDLELLRGLKEEYGVELPLSLKPLSTFPPISSDDEEDDFETLRAIQMRFSQYNGDADAIESKKDSCIDKPLLDDTIGNPLGNESFVDVCKSDAKQDPCDIEDNGETSSNTSSFPKAAQTFIEAIKKNRSCQKFIRSKMIYIEARLEEIKELHKRVKTLQGFRVRWKKKIGRELSQKQDARIQLISAPEQRANVKGTKKKVTAMCYGPLENSHVACYQTALTNFPLSFERKEWTNEERQNLDKGIIQQFQEMLLQKSTDALSALEDPGHSNGLDAIISSITNIDITPEIIQDFSGKVNWEQLASMYLPRRSGAECESRWLNYENRLISHDKWTPMEDKKLLLLVQQNGINNWSYLAEKLKTNRTPFQCLARYQRSLNASILRRVWTEDEDAQLRSAVESFGESNWEAVASVLEGRTGSQCSNRWSKTLHPARQRKGKWSDDEDKRLRMAATRFGHKNWHRIAQFVPGRTQAQCRERWVNVLNPSLNRGKWTEEDDCKLKKAILEHGYCWSKVAACVPRRTDNQCLRRWKTLFPHEVSLHRDARNIQKAALISNFVGRESERPALGPNDFVRLPIANSTNELEDDNVPRELTNSSSSREVRSRKCRKRARSPDIDIDSDCGDGLNNYVDDIMKDKNKITSKDGLKKKKCRGSIIITTEEKKKSSKSKELDETRETESWDVPITVRSRRPRGVRSKETPLMNGCNVVQSCLEENNDHEGLHDQSICPDSQLKTSDDKEVDVSNMDNMARKQSSSKLQPESRSLTETTRKETVDSSKRKVGKKRRIVNKLKPYQSEEWEDLPLAVLFSEAFRRIRTRKTQCELPSSCMCFEMSPEFFMCAGKVGPLSPVLGSGRG